MVRQEKMSAKSQTLALLIVAISIIAYSLPRFSDFLVYDGRAVLSGELWRLFTAPLVHFSTSHMFWDVLVFCAAGFAIEAKRYRGFWLVCIFAAVTPSLIFLLTLPQVERYGGLSGLATGAVAYFCLCSALKKRKHRFIWMAILVGMAMKIVAETAMGAPLFVQTGSIPFRVLPLAHILGYLGALITIMWTWPNIALHRTLKSRRI